MPGLVEALQPVLLSPTALRGATAAKAYGALGARCLLVGVQKAAALLGAWKPALLSASQARSAYAVALSELVPHARPGATEDAEGNKEITALLDALIALAGKESHEGTLSSAVEKACTTEKVWAGGLKGKEAFLVDAIGGAAERELLLMTRLHAGFFLRAPKDPRSSRWAATSRRARSSTSVARCGIHLGRWHAA